MGKPKQNYTREELIAICEQSIVPQEDWRNRDSESAQRGIGKVWALLKAGCEFEITKGAPGNCVTDHKTIWVTIWSKGFNYYESFCSYDGDDPKDYMERHHHYLPTPKRLEDAAGKDWY